MSLDIKETGRWGFLKATSHLVVDLFDVGPGAAIAAFYRQFAWWAGSALVVAVAVGILALATGPIHRCADAPASTAKAGGAVLVGCAR